MELKIEYLNKEQLKPYANNAKLHPVDVLPYSAIVEVARDYIFNHCGGFEKFAEWGLI